MTDRYTKGQALRVTRYAKCLTLGVTLAQKDPY